MRKILVATAAVSFLLTSFAIAGEPVTKGVGNETANQAGGRAVPDQAHIKAGQKTPKNIQPGKGKKTNKNN